MILCFRILDWNDLAHHHKEKKDFKNKEVDVRKCSFQRRKACVRCGLIIRLHPIFCRFLESFVYELSLLRPDQH
ncbi:hypothetical protein DPEC_G00081910 [Dallia pectoralis]|uniref:Uncharacterized protein n=1 Tax=Dallia pectoralis TaxID=75939 RepID=A0ACC2GYE1_DALPE|nr:hypothetical protein DPEC_G00081910 [Dallia pectoralis]